MGRMKNRYFLLFAALFICGGLTGAAFYQQEDRCSCRHDPVLARGEHREYYGLLLALQKHWADLSIYKGKPNGRFDRRMEQAVAAFQRKHGLAVTGILDEATWAVLGQGTAPCSFQGRRPRGRVEILVDLDALVLTVLVNRRPFRSFPVAIGKLETPSPAGTWKVVNKGYWTKGRTKWLGLSVPFGVYGIHGTNQPWTIGKRASKGCIRVFNHHLEQVYAWVKPGTPVYIAGDPFRDHRVLKRGTVGSDVYFLQMRLKQLGFYKQRPTGVFEAGTQRAVNDWQKACGRPVTGEIGPPDYWGLRLYPTD
jgi:peptidoglycan hydrolase-like protein with peptidoglycan-binding domain